MTSSDYRISNSLLSSRSLRSVRANPKTRRHAAEEASSMKMPRSPSDSPIDTVRAMRIRSDLARNDQLARNLDDANAWLGTADTALTSSVQQLQRVRDLV